jgi:hypothetical protein
MAGTVQAFGIIMAMAVGLPPYLLERGTGILCIAALFKNDPLRGCIQY